MNTVNIKINGYDYTMKRGITTTPRKTAPGLASRTLR